MAKRLFGTDAIKLDPRSPIAKYGKGGLKQKFDVLLKPIQDYVRNHPDIAPQIMYRRTALVRTCVLDKHPTLRTLLCELTHMKPKQRKFGKFVKDKSWHMHIEEPDGIYLPRMLALKVFGPSPLTDVFQGLPLAPELLASEPAIPLVTPEQCVGTDRVPQTLLVNAVVNHLVKSTSDGKQTFAGAVCCMPPGKGKTACALHMIHRLGRKALFIVPNLNLIPQVMQEARDFLGPACRVGSLQTSNPRLHKYQDCDVVVASLDSVVQCDYTAFMHEFGTFIVDEAHETCTAETHKVFNKTAAIFNIALTATPERADELGSALEWIAGPIVWFSPLTIQDTRWGQLQVVTHNLEYPDDNKLRVEFRMMMGEVMLDQEMVYDQLATHAARTTWLCNFLLELAAQGKQILCLGQRVNLMKNLYQHLQAQGADVGLMLGESNMDTKVTLADRDAVRQKQIRIFTDSIGYKALNVKALDTLVMLEPPVGDINSWIQRIGRVTRDYDKDVPTVHFLNDIGVREFESRVVSVVKKLKAFESQAFVFSTQVHKL